MGKDRRSGYYSSLETEGAARSLERKFSLVREAMEAAWEHNAEFRTRLDGAGMRPADVRTLDDWARIPVLRKKELIAFQRQFGLDAMLSCGLGELSRIYMSPGPIFDPEGRVGDYWGWAEAFHAAGFRKGDLVQMTFGYHLTPAGLMLEEPLRELGCTVIPAGPGNTAIQAELLTGLPVTGFVGMASFLKIIKDKALEQGADLKKDFNLEVAFVAAERLAESLRSELEAELGMLIRQGYGTADVGCIAYECPELSGMHLSSRCLVEVCDPATGLPVADGEPGEVVVTPFCKDYPLVRLATGDLSRLVVEPCACGRTSHRLAGILGRVDLTAKVKGQFIYPHQVAEVAAGFASVAKWQVVVDNPGGRDSITVRLALSGDLDTEAFAAAFRERIKLRADIEPGVHIADDAPVLVDNRTFD